MNEFWQISGPILLLLLLAAVAGLGAWVLILQQRVSHTRQNYQALLAGAEGGDLEAVLEAQLAELRRIKAQVETLTGRVDRLEKALPGALQRVGVVRFNPFADTGSDQSFAIALLDREGNGVVLSGLYARGGIRVYAKPVSSGHSEYTLSAEEEQAIAQAMRGQV